MAIEYIVLCIVLFILIILISIYNSRQVKNNSYFINIQEEAENTNSIFPGYYDEIGIITSEDFGEKPIILPLYGRKIIHTNRWEYFTKYNQWLLPVQYLNRDCQSNIGCDKIYNGADVIIPDYANKVFIVKLR